MERRDGDLQTAAGGSREGNSGLGVLGFGRGMVDETPKKRLNCKTSSKVL